MRLHVLLAVVSFSVSAHAQVLALSRPAGGDWLSLSLGGKKIGWAFLNVTEGTFEGNPAIVVSRDYFMRAKAGATDIEQRLRTEKYYERRESGRLLGFRFDRTEGGVTSTDSARCTGGRCNVIHSGQGPATSRVIDRMQ